MNLTELADHLHTSLGLLQKQDIQIAAQHLGALKALGAKAALSKDQILLGDDCAAIPDGDSYLLLAAEGMWHILVEKEPWFAGWCALMVNISDIYAMGGRPIAVVDTIWTTSATQADPVWEGMVAASQAYRVPIVGGHSNAHSPYNALSVAILGRAKNLLTSFNAQPGDVVLMAIDLRGKAHHTYPFWNAATKADPDRLRADLDILPALAESGLCDAAKDISMGGVVGTLLMFLEASACGAVLDLDTIPRPDDIPLERWLLLFPSYGFLLSARPEHVPAIQTRFRERNLACEAIAHITPTPTLVLKSHTDHFPFWDLIQQKLTGFSKG